MAKKVITTEEFTDDLDGTKAEGTVRFSFEGTEYEIDLSRRNRNAFDKVLKPYVDAARTVRKSRNSRRPATRGSRAAGPKQDLGAVREWARANGHAVSERGRIASSIIEAYEAAQG
ncbi:MAG: histone-like nucleoid-structuring protein Lsr2 [Jatrophihabitans sp.]|uniref:histone-like nucleoid-structuring protein Lsr2 n=1 Tax=Jatrophihabitans sp. TaxID=1932789 RepID=UPI003F7F130C